MNVVLIQYPEAFNCYEKLERKVGNILSNLDNYTIATIKDHNNLIARLCLEKLPDINFTEIGRLNLESITHAIIFDDGEEFSDLRKELKEKGVFSRFIKIKITRVINIKNETEYKGKKSTEDYEYIGRGSKWGNPHSMYDGDGDRDEVIRKFKYDFDFDKFPHLKKNEVYRLAGKRLGCFCKPANCHGDVLANYLNSWDDGE
ncbi:DUF4326 domain-containing protein [Endozoicomonas elysicola]|uniref:DUF4326 domain-containing protein n=1 Tax=Endozoicomonas elysicola TaxID=305900 RepID=A0A081K9F6_9GAMM|nr:DUF4326 domain-containing protein [Endozoicomonas elysicola]KEI70782.1 hypothetical protein GV64_08515 [Endozoicomonas elysicola]